MTDFFCNAGAIAPMPYPARPLVVMPTYNEVENIAQLVPAVLSVDDRIHILIVDDASPDNTAGMVRDLQGRDPAQRIFLQCRPGKLGLGSAYVQGLKWGLDREHDFLIQMDGDFSHHPMYLERMLRLARESDFVIGSRWVPGGGTLHWGVGRRLLSRFGSAYSRIVLGVGFADLTGGFNGWSGEVLRQIGLGTLKSEGYSFQIEMKYRAHTLGYTHVEFPICFMERRVGRSKMSASTAAEAFWRVWQMRLTRGKASASATLRSQASVPRRETAEKPGADCTQNTTRARSD